MSVPYPIGSSGVTDPLTNAYVVTPKDSEDFLPSIISATKKGCLA